jgi:ribosome-associated protein
MTARSNLRINSQLTIPRREIRFTFVRSSGPGGQNVNKVASKAVLRWSPGNSTSLPEDVRARFLVQFARRLNDRGELVLSSQRFRDQARNLEDCLGKLRSLIAAAAVAPKKRKKTRKPKAAQEARLRDKRAHAEKKQRRGPSPLDE